jgi:putative ABC transport system permease protein
MIRHLFKLLWNRKRASALIVLEILMSFLVLTAVIGGIAHFAINWQRPLGYQSADVWNLNVTIPVGEAVKNREATNERFASLIREVKAVPSVESAAGVMMAPYGLGDWTNDFGGASGRIYHMNNATDEFAETMGLELVEGRWFGPEDDGVDWEPVVLNMEAVRTYFPRGIAMGEVINADAEAEETRRRVIGVVREFRKAGELQTPEPYCFVRTTFDGSGDLAPENIVFRVASGSGTDLEVKVLERARQIAPEWTFEVRPLSVMRRGALRLQFAPIIAGAVIAGSLILLVALGLTGVMWQNVTRRTQEIGLRRAVGASSLSVQRQILTETLIVAAIGLAAGLLIVMQAPLAGLEINVDGTGIRPEVVAAGIGGAALMILAIVSLCAIYPSRLASSVEPAEALHYE